MKEYGISRPTVISLLKNQSATLKAVDSGIMNDKSKFLKKHFQGINTKIP